MSRGQHDQVDRKAGESPAATLGRQGGNATLKKYGKRKMREWGKKGGRPKKDHDQANGGMGHHP